MPVAGVPLNAPVEDKVTPLGNTLVVLKDAAGKPEVVNWNGVANTPTRKLVLVAFVMAGASFTVRVNAWSVTKVEIEGLVARIVKL